jgi:alpha-beta hydrolase superfamily lysophospholipase
MTHRVRPAALLALALTLAVVMGGCATSVAPAKPPAHASFDEYRQEALQTLRAGRAYRGDRAEEEARLNAPQEWRPEGTIRGGVLLVHGLGDSPWSFHDVGEALARQGFLARTVLLPGHGTQPGDMLHVSMQAWRDVVEEQAALLRRDAGVLYLGGFSTGANLVLDYAYRQPDVAGLLLFSPAFRSSVPLAWLAPVLSHVRPWLIDPSPAADALPVRYSMVPTNGFAQFYRTSQLAQEHLDAHRFDRPVLMVLAASDSVVDVSHAAQAFHQRFTHPASRLIWYGRQPPPTQGDTRVITRPDALPQWRISQFSHMGVLFAPDNPLYGREGSLKLCRNSRDGAAIQACLQGAEVWYSDWGYTEPGKVHARLTFNPYFELQTQVMAEVMAAGARDAALMKGTSAALKAAPGSGLTSADSAIWKPEISSRRMATDSSTP